jgi:hypothetical protein
MHTFVVNIQVSCRKYYVSHTLLVYLKDFGEVYYCPVAL